MAEAFLKVVLETLNSLIQKQFGLLWGVNREMENLSSMLSTIVAVLEDAEEKQLTDRAIKNWLQKLSDASFELDDVLDDCEMEASRLEYQGQKHRWTQKLDQIANERMKFHLREFVGAERRTQVRKNRQTSSIISQPNVYGREDDKERIVSFLVNDAIKCNDISIYAIVGLGGIGKTTLAQLVFNDERITRHFELKMWVCVSEDFEVKRIIKAIMESATGRTCEELDMDPLQRRLQDMLKGKRFLVVLDDVWNEDQDQWDMLKYVLSSGLNGSSIIVTTRLKTVASIMRTAPMHYLSGLSEDDCWLLFKQRAFGNEREEQPNLVKIGKEIVKKCAGVPLAAKALGGLMRFKIQEIEWHSVNQSEIWNLPQDKCSILPALGLSYLHMPIEQRRCFAYCAIFPKDSYIEKERLIHLWMANRLIWSKGEVEGEDMGNEICNNLCWLSFFQDFKESLFGGILGFKMHDLVHDLAQFITEEQCGIVELDKNNPVNLSSRLRHLTCNFAGSEDASDYVLDIPCAKYLRTFMVFRDRRQSQIFSHPHMNYPSLRAFDARFLSFTSISS